MKNVILISLAIFAISCGKSKEEGAPVGGAGGQQPGTAIGKNSSQLAQGLAGKYWCSNEFEQNEQGQAIGNIFQLKKDGSFSHQQFDATSTGGPTEVQSGLWSASNNQLTIMIDGKVETAPAVYDANLQTLTVTDEEGTTVLQYCGDSN